jgi:S-phase kinase-associated protein 1
MTTEEKNPNEVILTSKEGKKFKVSKKAVLKSGLIRDILEDEDESNKEDIPLPNASSQALEKVIQYCEHYKDEDPLPLEKPLSKRIEELVCDFDRKFLIMDLDVLLDLIMTANYLNIPSLLELACGKVASLLKGKSIEQLREFLGIVNDFTPEEEKKIREEEKIDIYYELDGFKKTN